MSKNRRRLAILGLAVALGATGAIAVPAPAEALGMAGWNCLRDAAYAGRSWTGGGQTTADHDACGALKVRLTYTRNGQPGYSTEYKKGTTRFVGLSMGETTGACHTFTGGGWVYRIDNCT